METVFITIHDLTLDARIRYASDSVEDILGYLPHEVKGKSCWEYFHPDEIPFARAAHGRGIALDKAAVLNYCQVKHKDGSWIGCECVFSVVYDVLVACTSIYRRGPRSTQRAIDGAGIRRVFSSSPRDPRYHMLSYISDKFRQAPKLQIHEPRAALFLNRFTRTSTVMFATNGLAEVLGIEPAQVVGKSFYYCISENCLQDAIRCLESAKANDSIAYLRFWSRDPLQGDPSGREASMPDVPSSDDDEDEGGVRIMTNSLEKSNVAALPPPLPEPQSQPLPDGNTGALAALEPAAADQQNKSRASSSSSGFDRNDSDAIFDRPALRHSSTSLTPEEDYHDVDTAPSVEVEAVVSCTSDGLVVVLRRAMPLVPHAAGQPDAPRYANGLFASPWATEPVMPPHAPSAIPPEASDPPGLEPEPASFMHAIRECAVFAWSLTGINGNIAQYGRGKPTGESLPPGGLPVWDPKSNADPENRYNGFSGGTHRPVEGMGEPLAFKKDEDLSSSEDEVLWKRVPNMPAFRKPVRRGHHEAFGTDMDRTELEERIAQSRRRKLTDEGQHS